MRRFNVLKKYDVVSKFDNVDMFGRTRRFRRTPSPHAAEPALLCNFDGNKVSEVPEPFDQTRHSATSIKSRIEAEEEKATNKIDVSQYIETINLADIELPPENPKKSKKHKDKKHKSEKKDRSERKRHKEKKRREKHEKEAHAPENSLDKRLENVSFKDDTHNFLLTIETGRTFMHDNIDDLSKSKSDDIDLDVHQFLGSDDEEYDRRFSDVKRYIPFLEMMIEKHRQMNDLKSLKKMECLYEVLTQSKKKLKMETLRRCEDVLEKLYHKVGEVLREETSIEAPNDDNLSTVSSSLRNTRFHQIGNLDASFEEGCMSPMSSPSSSPTPPYSPNNSLQPVDDDIDNDAIIEHLESQAESLEDGEIFDASGNSDDDTDNASVQSISRVEIPTSSKRDSDMSIDEEWDILEEKPQSPKQDKHTWKPIIVTGHDVVTAAKLVGNNISKRAAPAPRSYTPPPKPVENKQLEEVFVDDDSYDSFNADLNDTIPRSDSPLNVPEMGLQSPDPELFSEERSNSPKKPEEPPQPVPPPEIQPIVAPPRVNDIPLISMADLEDLIKNQSKILKDGLQQQQQTKDEKDAEKEKEAAKAQELETVTPIRRKQTGNVKIAPMTLKLDAFITGGKDRSPSPEAPVDPRIRARMLKEKNVDPRLAKEKAAIPPRPPPPPPPGDLYSLHDFNINPATLSSPIHTTPVTPKNDYPPTGSGNQWNYGSNIPMPGTPNPYGMPRDSNMHTDSWDMNSNMHLNLNPNININRNPNMNLNRNPNMAQNCGYGNNIMPLMRPAVSYPPYDSQMNYPQHPQHPQHQQYPHGPSPLDNFNTNSVPYGHQQPASWNRSGDAIRNHRPVLNRDPRSMNNLRDVHRPEWDRERQSDWDWDRDRQSDWDRERQMDRERPLDRERHSDWDNRNRFNRDPRMRLESLVSSPNQVKEVTKDTSTTRDQTTSKEQTTSKDSSTTKDSTIRKETTTTKDSTTSKDSTTKKDSTTTKDSTTRKDPRLSTKEKPKAVEKEKDSKKPDTKDSYKNFKSSSKSDSRKPKEKEKSRNKEKSRKSDSRRRQESEKGEKSQSSLESLYGVVDTKAAAGQQVLQKFKIPKLKKPEPVSSPKATTSSDTKIYRHEDLKSSSKNDDPKSRDRRDKSSQSKGSLRKDREKDKDKKKSKKQDEVIEPAKTKDHEEKLAEAEKSRLKTVEDLKNFINMILTQKGGKKLLKNPVMYDKFQKVFENEDLTDFRRLVQSDSDSSDSGKNERVTKKRKPMMKKRRVIESDSSESEEDTILMSRIGKLESPANEEEVEEAMMSRILRKRPGAAKEPEEDPEKESKKEVVKEGTTKEDINYTVTKDEQLKDPKEQTELVKEGAAKESNESLITEPTTPKARAKPRRKNSLERLQEDLKDYISSGIITAGQRTCRLARESQAATTTTVSSNTSNVANESVTESTEIDELVKSRTKNKVGPKCARKTVSKDFVSNSETEEDQPLALRKEPVKKKKMLGPKSKRQASDLALEPQLLLQRAETFTREELFKVNESSSDESADVSEMTVSPDSPTTDSSKAEITKRPRTRSGAAARKRGKLSNKEDEAQATDDESLTSDISLSSSVAGKRADEMAKAFQELLEKDGEAAEATEDSQPTDKVGKKPPAKKKKKKSAWRLGIVSKAKRRKKQLQAQEKQAATLQAEDVDIRRPSIEVIDDLEVRKEMHGTDESTSGVKGEPHQTEEQKRNSSQAIKEPEIVVKQEIKLEDLEQIVKREESVMEVDSLNDSDLMIVGENMKDDELEINMNINQLIDYVCYSQEKVKCLRCIFSGKSIVHHYKTVHPGKEVSVSRLKALEAKSAIQESNDNDFKNTGLLPTKKKDYHFSCRFCSYDIKGRKEESMESAYEHVTSHTGEYRFRCIECNYQSIARSTMKMHYYKNCKKLGKTIHEAVVEQKVPQESRLYGYMCSLCNFVQLRVNSVEDHIKVWHHLEPSPKIVKINMSLDAPGENAVEVSETLKKPIEISILDDEESTSVEKRNTRSSRRNRVEEEEPQVTLPDDLDDEVEKEEAEKEARKSNLSAFVCPPELEKKNEEIELERKKKMQEIVENMGINVKKNVTKKGLSIIDKLKDKMDTTVESQTAESDFRGDLDSPESGLRNVESLNEETENLICSEALSNADISDSREVLDTNETDKSSKLKDPLDVENEPQEDEASDSEHPSLRYEYESSSENENEDATDVNDLLKETGDIKNQSNDSMVTTIQRLAAQIQSSKPLETASTEVVADDAANLDRSSAKKEIPKAPDVLPITSFRRKSLSVPQNIQVIQEDQSQEPRMGVASPPKLFLRPRRFSGDMLSVPEPSSETPDSSSPVVGPSTDDTEIETSEESLSALNISTTESDSFLKISNIVSLATTSENESPMMSDIRKAVETSHVKLSGLSVLKKNGPLILKRVKNPPTHTLSNQTIRAVNPSSHETVKLIPINITPTSSGLTNSQSNYLPIMSPATFKNYMDAKKVAIPASSLPNAITTKPATLTPVPISKPVTKPGTLTPVTLSPNTSGFSINNALQNYTPIKPNNFTSIKAGTITAIKSGTVTLSKPTTAVTSATSPNRKLVTLVGPSTLLKQKEHGPQYAIKMKNMAAYNEMMKPERLRELFKCMGRDCSYTTDYVENFKRHFEKHSASSNANSSSLVPFDFKKCAYCYMTATDWYQMEKHYEEKHAYCEFQCSYCFYRAVTQAYVEIHQANIHPKKQVAVLQGSVSNNLRPQIEVNRSERVKPFVCQNECNKYFFVPEAFFVHLRLKHATLPVYKCHLCKVASYTPDQLIEHYKNHGILKYQCLYCNHGTESMTEMHSHLSSNHCNQKPILLERTLPPQPTKTRSAIDQLLLRNAEEQYTLLSKVIGIPEKKSANVEIDVIKDTNACIKPSSEKAESSNYVISVAPTRSNSPPTIKIIATESLVSNDNVGKTDSPFRKMTESISRAEKNRDSTNHHKELNVILQYKSQDTQKAVESAVDPLGILHDASTEDEFINMNLLDNPEFLKARNSIAKNTTKVDDDDSDIEIIEDCGRPGSRDTTMIREPSTTPDVKPKNPHLLLNSADNSDVSNDASSLDTPSPSKTNSFLTLEDIKHTGFIGMDLYKCGTLNCNYSAPNSTTLKNHIKECCVINPPTTFNNSANFQCNHCRKAFQKIGFFMEHLEIHGLKRFCCAVCGERYAIQNQALTHLKMKHKVTSYKLLPADPKNPSADGLFVVHPVSKGKKKIPAPKFAEKESPKCVESDTLTFSPNEIDLLPRQAIYNREVQCAVCRFATKVRTNIIRHLQFHAKDESVPESGPVNPVPCLDKREKMFDKMVNLASSSHQNGRMGAKSKESSFQPEDESLPKYVPENKRYVCGISECSYLTVNEGMLRYHLKALHSEEPFFKCTHCKAQGQDAQNIVIEKMGVHLKMHDSKLYKCSHCNYFHYQRYVVERHLGDKHPEKRPFVKVIREFESSESSQSSTLEENEDETPDPDGNHWKCNACDYKCVYKAEMQTHVGNEHDEKSQYKCTACPFRTNGKIQLDQHINAKHPNDPEVDYQIVYQRIKGTKKLTDPVEQGTPEEPFDTTPLWRRDMSRVKHIRGILIEEEPTKKASPATPTTPEKFGKRKSDTDISAKPGKVRCMKPVETDDNDPKRGQYGYYGSPKGASYECTICNQFKTKYKHDMRDHLYRELKYVRFHCKTCGFVSVNKNSLSRHCSKNHEGEVPNCESLSPDSSIEEWVMTLLKLQTEAIKKNLEKLNPDAGGPGTSKSASPIKQNTPRSPGQSLLNTSGPMDVDSEDDSDENYEDASDDDVPEIIEEGSSSDQPKKLVLICKHCKQTFNSKRGFKMHVRKQHLKQYKFLCPLCDRSANLESQIQQHIKSKHPGRSMKPIPNEVNDTELTDEFWLKEYEVPPGKEKRGQKRKANFEEIAAKILNANVVDDTFTCLKCNFVSANLAGHISHQKTHKLLFKCAYCSYTGMLKNEIKKHSKSDHPHLTPNVEEIPITGNAQVASSRLSNGQVSSLKTGKESLMGGSSEQKFNYWCSYCSVRCKTQFAMKKHWTRAHKDPKPNEGAKWKTGPFDYTTILQSPATAREIVSTSPNAQGNKSEDVSCPSDEKWNCEWCNELCQNRNEVEHHHVVFHSHLPLKCKPADPLQIPEDYRCPECSFETKTYELMYKHINKHIRMFKCKYCEQSFCEPNQVTLHAEQVHPGVEPKIESVQNYEEQLSDMLNRITGGLGLESESSEHQSVAKKSTARPIVRVRPFPKKLKSVARKSTNPLPRYPPGLKFSNEHANVRGISHYGVPRAPIDMGSIKTYMVVGGHRMLVNCLTLSQLMNIDPRVIVVDIKKGLNMSR